MPGAGALTKRSLQNIAKQSCNVLRQMGTQVQWVETFVTADKLYCVYIAADESLIKEHAKLGDFPADAVNEVMAKIDPVSAEEAPGKL